VEDECRSSPLNPLQKICLSPAPGPPNSTAEFIPLKDKLDASDERSGLPAALETFNHDPKHELGYSTATSACPQNEYPTTETSTTPQSDARPMRHAIINWRSRFKLTVCVMRRVKNILFLLLKNIVCTPSIYPL
jgi:hypothetical protein